MATAKLREPGTAATQDFSFYTATAVSGTSTIASSALFTGGGGSGARSIKIAVDASGDQAYAYKAGALSDAGRGVHITMAMDAYKTSYILYFYNAAFTQLPFSLFTTAGVLSLQNDGIANVAGTTVLNLNQVYDICVSYVITNTTTYTIKVYLNGVLEISCVNSTSALGTLASTGTDTLFVVGGGAADGPVNMYFSNVYADDRADGSDTGAARVTFERPNANGTTNGFTTQIGAGGSGFGTGHSPQVNEIPLSQTNGWSMIGAGSAITEEYNIQSASGGDVDLRSAALVDVAGWVFGKSLASETGKIVVDGTQTNISLTSAPTLFVQSSATPTVYPAGTGADIGIITTTALTTVSLYECGILVTYLPARMIGAVAQLNAAFVGGSISGGRR